MSVELTREDFALLDVFHQVSVESIWYLLEFCPVMSFGPGETLIEKGKSNQTMFLVLSGRLSIHLDKESDEPVDFLERGQTVGEVSVIDDSPATAFVRACEASRVLAIGEECFWDLVSASHEFAANILLLLARRLRANTSTIRESIVERRKLQQEATVDILTGLHNRRWLDANVDRLVQRHQRGSIPLSLVMLDIDHFKKFNDTFGHAAGDLVLSGVARMVMDKLRPSDLAARYGGEEFVILLPNTNADGALVACERIRFAVTALLVVGAQERPLPPVTISLGMATLRSGESGTELQERADQALYKAKENGRNRTETSGEP